MSKRVYVGVLGAVALLSSSCAADHYAHVMVDVPEGVQQLQSSEPAHLLPVDQRIAKNSDARRVQNSRLRKDMSPVEVKLHACMELLYSHCRNDVARLEAENALLRQRLSQRLMPQQVVMFPPAY
jgi:hypothetical protein